MAHVIIETVPVPWFWGLGTGLVNNKMLILSPNRSTHDQKPLPREIRVNIHGELSFLTEFLILLKLNVVKIETNN